MRRGRLPGRGVTVDAGRALGRIAPLLALLALAPRAIARGEGIEDPRSARLKDLLAKDRFAEAEAEARQGPDPCESLHLLVNALLESRKEPAPAWLGLAREVLAMARARLPLKDPRLVKRLSNLAWLHFHFGELSGARPLLEEALQIREREIDADPLELAAARNNLALLLRWQGDFEAAERLYREVLDFRRPRAPAEPGLLAQALNNLAVTLQNQGKTAEAEQHAREALERWRKLHRESHADVATSLNNLGWILQEKGERVEAQGLLAEALRLRERLRGPEHPETAWTRSNLAFLLLEEGDLEGARTEGERALAARRRALGERHPLVALSLADLARIEARAGATERALERALEAEEIGREQLLLATRVLPERQALHHAITRGTGLGRASGLPVALTAVADAGSGSTVGKAWDALIRSRALVLDEMARRGRWLAAARGRELARLVEEASRARERFANLTVRGPGGGGAERYRASLGEALREKEMAERTLAERSVEFRDESARSRAGLAEVQAALPPRSALVSFARFEAEPLGRTPGARASPRYLAFALRKEAPERTLSVPLGPAEVIEEHLGRWRALLARRPGTDEEAGAEAEARAAGETVRKALWDPLARLVGPVERVFVVPDGALHLVSLAALPAEGGGYLVETGPLIHLLSAERDLIPAGAASGAGLLALGGPAFDAPPGGVRPRPASEPGPPSAPELVSIAIAPVFRGRRPGCPDFDTHRFAPLPAAAREAEEVAELFRNAGERAARGEPAARRGAADALALNREEASEEAFKALAPGRRILHLATHGFFLGKECPSALAGARGFGELVPAGAASPAPRGENPLLRAGLALAGANHRRAAGPGDEDGILTAEEIGAMDLTGVELAVLSACDTGVGEVRDGEGVLGLRRAFQAAGARTLVLSLWAVEDEAARRWMDALYAAHLLDGLPAAEAARAASRKVLAEGRRRGRPTHPFHWAGFVAAGEWR